jgi:hypothetical protein
MKDVLALLIILAWHALVFGTTIYLIFVHKASVWWLLLALLLSSMVSLNDKDI